MFHLDREQGQVPNNNNNNIIIKFIRKILVQDSVFNLTHMVSRQTVVTSGACIEQQIRRVDMAAFKTSQSSWTNLILMHISQGSGTIITVISRRAGSTLRLT